MSAHMISLGTAILTNINLMVGAGIYFMPPLMAAAAGNISYLGWSLVGIIFLPVVMSIATIARLLPGQGSFFRYASKGMNNTIGFFSGWMYFLGYTAIGAMQILALQDELSRGLGLTWVTRHSLLFSIVFIGILCMLNMGELRVIGILQNYITIFKLLPLFIIILFLIPFGSTANIMPLNTNLSNISWTIPFALFGFWGFETCASMSHRIRGDNANASRAILIGFFSTVAIYTLVHFSLIAIMGSTILQSNGVAHFSEALATITPRGAYIVRILVQASILSAYVNAIFGALTANGFLLSAMANENLLYGAGVLKKQNRSQQPIYAICFQGALMVLLSVLIHDKTPLTALGNIGLIIPFTLTLLSLMLIQLRSNNRQSIAKKFLWPLLAFGSCAVLGYFSIREITQLAHIMPILILAAIGVGLNLMRKKSNHT